MFMNMPTRLEFLMKPATTIRPRIKVSFYKSFFSHFRLSTRTGRHSLRLNLAFGNFNVEHK